MNEKSITRVLNEKQFAQTVGLSYAKIKQMRRQGFIKHSKVGRRILYKFPEHVEMFLSNFEQAG